jgi:hypothetical protein
MNPSIFLGDDPREITRKARAPMSSPSISLYDGPARFRSAAEGGETGPMKRRRMEREIRALDLSFPSWLRQAGFDTIEKGGAALVDWLGQSGFPADITLHGEAIDEALGAPATAKIEAMSAALRRELDGRLATLLRPVIATMDVEKPCEQERRPVGAAAEPIIARPSRQGDVPECPRPQAGGLRFPRPARPGGADRFH